MQAKAIVMNPCFYKGFFNKTKIAHIKIIYFPFTHDHKIE